MFTELSSQAGDIPIFPINTLPYYSTIEKVVILRDQNEYPVNIFCKLHAGKYVEFTKRTKLVKREHLIYAWNDGTYDEPLYDKNGHQWVLQGTTRLRVDQEYAFRRALGIKLMPGAKK